MEPFLICTNTFRTTLRFETTLEKLFKSAQAGKENARRVRRSHRFPETRFFRSSRRMAFRIFSGLSNGPVGMAAR